ncbi:MAG: Antitoxin of toxin-antitoxin stability system [Gemmataceae bacterium]|nr:Antitoxin of toxin-antitoxin stability system [Gemmataceae bacterium]
MATITIEEARANLDDLIHRLTPGEEVVITENNRPVAKLVASLPEEPRKVPKLGTQRGSVLSMEHFDDPLEDFKEYTE